MIKDDKRGEKTMKDAKKTTTILVRRGLGEAKYYACDEGGNPIMGFNKLSDVRKRWEKEIQWGYVKLVRELDKTPDMKIINETIKSLHGILRAYTRKKD